MQKIRDLFGNIPRLPSTSFSPLTFAQQHKIHLMIAAGALALAGTIYYAARTWTIHQKKSEPDTSGKGDSQATKKKETSGDNTDSDSSKTQFDKYSLLLGIYNTNEFDDLLAGYGFLKQDRDTLWETGVTVTIAKNSDQDFSLPEKEIELNTILTEIHSGKKPQGQVLYSIADGSLTQALLGWTDDFSSLASKGFSTDEIATLQTMNQEMVVIQTFQRKLGKETQIVLTKDKVALLTKLQNVIHQGAAKNTEDKSATKTPNTAEGVNTVAKSILGNPQDTTTMPVGVLQGSAASTPVKASAPGSKAAKNAAKASAPAATSSQSTKPSSVLDDLSKTRVSAATSRDGQDVDALLLDTEALVQKSLGSLETKKQDRRESAVLRADELDALLKDV